jgi:hypothetical protein
MTKIDDDDDVSDEPVSLFRKKKDESKLIFFNSLNALIDEAETKESKKRKILVLVSNLKQIKEILTALKNKHKEWTGTPHSVNNVTVSYDMKPLRGQIFDYILAHEDADPEIIVEARSHMTMNNREIEEFAKALLKKDSNRELCRECKETDVNSLPYGEYTGQIESVPQYNNDGEPLLDEEGSLLYLDFPELKCEKGHHWFKGEGPRRDIKGVNPILFESHLYNRRRREIMVKDGIPDPSYSKNRFGRPEHLMYNRSTPDGRKINTKEQRSKHGASYFR